MSKWECMFCLEKFVADDPQEHECDDQMNRNGYKNGESDSSYTEKGTEMSKGDEVKEPSKKIEIPEGGLDRVIDVLFGARELQIENESLRKQNEIYREALSKIDSETWILTRFDLDRLLGIVREALKVGKDE